MAARTSRVRLGTYVFLLGLRHPLVSARGFQTADVISNGRIELGVGAGWLESEWRAGGMDWKSRGRALDEAIDVCRRLWTERVVEHSGETWQFEPVWFEPKPVQPQGPPILIGGESNPALRRAVTRGDGWIAMEHSPASLAPKVARLRELAAEHGRAEGTLPITAVGALPSPDSVAEWEAVGVDRLIVTPWKRSREAIEGMTRLAGELGLNAGIAG
jgi:probable F420-dependent oxidoreductase